MLSLILSTAPDLETARRISTVLLDQNLAACVSIVPGVESQYRWEGKIERAEEFLLLIKSLPEKWEELQSVILKIHPYECPEIVRFDSSTALVSYLEWVCQSVRE